MVKKNKGGAVMKTISIFLALINSLLAGLLISFLVTSVDFEISKAWWSVARILLALSVIGIGVLTWLAAILPVKHGLIVLGSLFLVAIGPSTVVWTFHRASMTGDMEYYMLVYGGSLFVQGIALLFGISHDQRNITAA